MVQLILKNLEGNNSGEISKNDFIRAIQQVGAGSGTVYVDSLKLEKIVDTIFNK